jgi:hypothetical protein
MKWLKAGFLTISLRDLEPVTAPDRFLLLLQFHGRSLLVAESSDDGIEKPGSFVRDISIG